MKGYFYSFFKEIEGKQVYVLTRDGLPVQVLIEGQDLFGDFAYDENRGVISVTPKDKFVFIGAYVVNEKKKWWQFWKPNYRLMKPFQIKL